MYTKPNSKARIPLDLHAMQAFKMFFHGNESAIYVALFEGKAREGAPETLRGTVSNCSKRLEQANQSGAGIFMAINSIQGDRPVDSAVSGINAVWLDSDGSLSKEDIEKLKPHAIVETSKDRFHAYWRVSDLRLEDFKPVQQAIAEKFGTDPSVCNPARIMRMPGSVHRKGKSQKSTILKLDKSADRVPYLDLLKRLGVDPAVRDRAAKKQVEDAAHTSAEGIESALKAIPCPEDRTTWLKIGMSVHSATPDETGFVLWDRHSSPSSKYNTEDQRKAWNSFTSNGAVTIASLFYLARRYGWKPIEPSKPLPVDEFALVDEFAERAKDRLRFVVESAQWLLFQSPVWGANEAHTVQEARAVVKAMTEQAKREAAAGTLALLRKFSNTAQMRGLLRDASAVPILTAHLVDFDQHSHLLGVANGVIDLTTGVLRPGRPEDMLRTSAPTVFDPEASCPEFKRFIRFFVCDDRSYAYHLQRILGYVLFGHTHEQVFFILRGGGGNGKGTLLRVLAHVLGRQLVRPISANLLTRAYAGNANGPTEALMALNGPRLVHCGEGEGGKPFDTAFIKQLSGSDAFTARSNHGHQTDFTPICKLMLALNELPELPHEDEAMWRRIVVLPCNANIENRDGAFEEKLRAESSGILNWLIKGALEYGQERLGESEAVTRATRLARQHFDSVGSWIEERCSRQREGRIAAGPAFEDYRKYCRAQGRPALSPQMFPRAMKGKGFEHKQTKKGNLYIGLCIRSGAGA